MKGRILLAVALTVGLLVATPGCNRVRQPDEPRPGTETTTPKPAEDPPITPPGPAGRMVPSAIYLVSGEKVAAVYREVEGPAVATEAMKSLLAGPTPTETDQGLGTTIPKGTRLLSLSIAEGVASVDLSQEFDDGGGTLSMSARVAQVVFTLTRYSTVERVRFLMEGEPLNELGGEGLIIGPSQTRTDCESMAPAVLVERPAWGARISTGSNIAVTGSANVFEAVFTLELTDGDGGIVGTQRVQASSGTGTRGTFSAKMAMPSDAKPGWGAIIASYQSPKDGSRVVVTEIPLQVIAQ